MKLYIYETETASMPTHTFHNVEVCEYIRDLGELRLVQKNGARTTLDAEKCWLADSKRTILRDHTK